MRNKRSSCASVENNYKAHTSSKISDDEIVKFNKTSSDSFAKQHFGQSINQTNCGNKRKLIDLNDMLFVSGANQ